MLATLAFRHLLVRKLRSLFLLLGFALGVGVMIVLLSVGEAMLDQARDVSLVGGGELTVLPQGIDIEAMRTGGLSGMFFGIERARFLTRVVLGGARHGNLVSTVAPAIEGKLLYLCPVRDECRATAVRAGGEIPSRAAALGAGLTLRAGRWTDLPADSAYILPGPGRLYDELDRFHLPARADSSWGEWHYFNLVTGPDEWWYVTFLVGGALASSNVRPAAGKSGLGIGPEAARRGDATVRDGVPVAADDGRGRTALTGVSGAPWGGRVLVTRRRRDGRYDRYTREVPAAGVTIDTAGADLTIGSSTVRQRDGLYRIVAEAAGAAGTVRLDLALRPLANRYFPPVELREEELLSGYVVPGLAAVATGRICASARCDSIRRAPAYHDHNWGVWRDVTWEWGAGRGPRLSLLYGGVYESGTVTSPFFLTLVDSLGVRQVLRFRRIDYRGSLPAEGAADVTAPARFELVGTRGADSVRLAVRVRHALATEMGAGGFRRFFLQMRGSFELGGRVGGGPLEERGEGFFETYLHPR